MILLIKHQPFCHSTFYYQRKTKIIARNKLKNGVFGIKRIDQLVGIPPENKPLGRLKLQALIGRICWIYKGAY